MSKITHTPGPWSAYGEPTMIHEARILSHDGTNSVVARGVSMANARLIAAAPELLEALQLMVKQIESLLPQASTLSYGRSAIAKATGGAE